MQTPLQQMFDYIENGLTEPLDYWLESHKESMLKDERKFMETYSFNFYYDHSIKMKCPFNKISENRTHAEIYFDETFKH